MKYLAMTTGLAIAACSPAYAQQCVGPVEFIQHVTIEEFNQSVTGTLPDGVQMQIWAHEDGRYLVVAIAPNGYVCLLANGYEYSVSNSGGDL